jgi:hypothetical protein
MRIVGCVSRRMGLRTSQEPDPISRERYNTADLSDAHMKGHHRIVGTVVILNDARKVRAEVFSFSQLAKVVELRIKTRVGLVRGRFNGSISTSETLIHFMPWRSRCNRSPSSTRGSGNRSHSVVERGKDQRRGWSWL